MSKSSLQILYLDIETAPDLAWVWGAYEQNAIEIYSHWYILSFAARWNNQTPFVHGLPDYPSYHANRPWDAEAHLLQEVHGMLEAADVVVAHNGIDFDFKKLNARFIAHGMKPPAPYKVVDTKREVKKVAAFSSNKLDWLCGQLELGRKRKHEGFPLWKGCMDGDPRAWKKMKSYNVHDVRLLTKLYKLLSPWITQPNAVLYGQKCVNSTCKGGTLQARGFARSRTHLYRRFQCVTCGAWSRTVHSEKASRATRIPIR